MKNVDWVVKLYDHDKICSFSNAFHSCLFISSCCTCLDENHSVNMYYLLIQPMKESELYYALQLCKQAYKVNKCKKKDI